MSTVRVRRTGGFAGIVREGEVDLESDERGPELRDLIGRVDLAGVVATPRRPDRYVFEFDFDGDTAQLGEPDLTPDLRRIADLVLP